MQLNQLKVGDKLDCAQSNNDDGRIRYYLVTAIGVKFFLCQPLQMFKDEPDKYGAEIFEMPEGYVTHVEPDFYDQMSNDSRRKIVNAVMAWCGKGWGHSPERAALANEITLAQRNPQFQHSQH